MKASAEPEARQGLTDIALATDVRYSNVIDAGFLAHVGREGLSELRGDDWVTSAESLDNCAEQLLARAGYGAGHSEVLTQFQGAVAHVTLRAGSVSARIAGVDGEAVEHALRSLRDRLPKVDAESRRESQFSFWWETGRGPMSLARTLAVPSIESIAGNYAGAAQAQLRELAKLDDPGRSGKLLLLHGEPGGGKTYAIRALSWEWRHWCDFHYIADPDALLGTDGAGYMIHIVTSDAESRGGLAGRDRWRCLVFEDTGELVTADARERTGQGLSRLLNVVDGLIGQGINILVAISTNEPLSKLHPAMARPGRCLAEIEFGRFGVAEANAWLERSGCGEKVSHAASLAELYSIAAGEEPEIHDEFGFAA